MIEIDIRVREYWSIVFVYQGRIYVTKPANVITRRNKSYILDLTLAKYLADETTIE